MKPLLRLSGLALAIAGVFLSLSRANALSPALGAPSNLSASVVSVGDRPQVHLQWSPVSGAYLYQVIRDSRFLGYVRQPAYTDLQVVAGETHTYAVNGLGKLWGPGASASVTVTVPTPAPPAPTGLKAVGQWVTNCPKCAMPMAHIILSWNAVPQADGYRIYRDGVLLADGITSPDYTDMAVISGKAYSYTVCAVHAGIASPQSAPATATAPNPPASAPPMADLVPPTNLAAHGVWQGGPADLLTWDAVPGAAAYNVYQYDQLIGKGVTAPSFAVPSGVFNGSMTYTVTAVSGDAESIPSAIAMAAGAADPAQKPAWMPDAPVAPSEVVAVPEWNAGRPRVRLTWCGHSTDDTYSVYRDGVKVADGLWRLCYLDAAVAPGETHTYAVTGVNVPWTAPVESAPSASVTATAPTGPPSPLPDKVQIAQVIPNDDSAVVFFQAVPGAADYRIYDVTKPGSVKYSGGGTSIEMNGLDPGTGADLVVEAVDKPGPFQKMDGSMGPGAMGMDGTMTSAVNGQGDPSNAPLVLARSDVFHVTCRPLALTGAQVFLDNFRGSQPFTPSALDPVVAALSNSWLEIGEVENDKWRIRTYDADTAMTKAFLMGNHFMDTLYDGPTAAGHPFSHNNNASLVMMPKATADISGGQVLHVTFEVDAHFDSRRWCDVFVAEAGDPLLEPGKFAENNDLPTVKGNLFRWEIHAKAHDAQVFLGKDSGGNLQQVELFDEAGGVGPDDFGPPARTTWDGKPLLNGTAQDLDRRHRFDLYLSQTRFRVTETAPGTDPVLVKDETFPGGVALPFDTCQVYLVHQLYHTANDRHELIDYSPDETYWYNDRPWSDERHWDNIGEEVLPGFPK